MRPIELALRPALRRRLGHGLCAVLCLGLVAPAGRAADLPPPPPPPSVPDEGASPAGGPLPGRAGFDGDADELDEAGAAVLSTPYGRPSGGLTVSAGVGAGGGGVFLGLLGLALVADAGSASARESAAAASLEGPLEPRGDALRDRAEVSDVGYGSPYGTQRRHRREAREGFLFSLGIGGAQNYLSGAGHAAGFAFDVRMGYGFSDRFQLFFDLSALPASYAYGQQATSYTGTVRGQTVLIGDRQGNGLNLNLGVGLGGIDSYGPNAPFASSRAGLALAGGLSVDLRVSPWFAISPELTAQWHQVPNDFGFPSDIHRAFGGQLNFVWYNLY